MKPRNSQPLFVKRPIVNTGRFILFLLLLITNALLARTSSAAERQVVRGHIPEAVTELHLQPVGRLPGSTNLYLAIGLPLRNTGALTNLLEQLCDPSSPQYHHWLTPNQFAQIFGPSGQDYQAVIDFAKTNGLQVVNTHGNRVLLDVSGNVSDIEKAFHVTLRTYQHPTEARQFFAPDIEPSVDTSVPMLHVSGLDNYVRPRPALHMRPATGNASPASGSAPYGNYMGNDFKNAYAPNVTLDGSNQMIGLVEFDGYYTNDIATYERQAGLPQVPLTNVLLDGVSGVPSTSTDNVAEVSLDIELVISMATNLTQVMVFEGAIGSDILNSMVANTQIKQFSSSWFFDSPNSLEDQILQQMVAQGQSFFQASGDGDAWCGPIMWPADDPYVTSVGGTTLDMNGSGASYASETVWNFGYDPPGWYGLAGDYIGSGGGVSTSYSIPPWQRGVNMTAVGGSATMRNIPDVAMNAANVWACYFNNLSGSFWGTSCAAPLWAAFTALVNQQGAANGQPSAGFLNPTLYTIGTGSVYSLSFHDITTGNNTNPCSTTNYFAATGYDLCTGWGSPAGSGFINALTNLLFTINSWVNSGNDKWETATNWSLGRAPSPSDSDYITNASTKTVTIDAVTTSTPSALTFSNLFIAGTASSTNTLLLNNAGTTTPLQALGGAVTLDANGAMVVNNSSVLASNNPDLILIVGNAGGNASLTITNGGAVYSANGELGNGVSGGNNIVLVSGTGSAWSNANNLVVGNSGAGNQLVVANGALVVDGNGTLGNALGSSNNTVLVSGTGSVWSNPGSGVNVGAYSAGNQLIITNGGAMYDGVCNVGGFATSSSNNTLVVTGTGSVLNSSRYFVVGYLGGTGNQLIVTAGGTVIDNNGTVGTCPNSAALVSGTGSVWSNSGIFVVGDRAMGNQLIIANGGLVVDNSGTLGNSPSASNNTVLVSGSGSVWSNQNDLYVGCSGAGNSLTIANGSTVFDIGVAVGYYSSSSNNVVTVTGSGSAWSNIGSLGVGYSGSGSSLVISNGGAVFNTDGGIGVGGSNNVVTVAGAGSVWQNSSTLYVGYDANSNVLTIAGGSVSASNAFVGYSDSFGLSSNNVLRVNNGSLFVTNASGDGALVVSQAGGNGNLIINGGSVTVDSLIATNGPNGVVQLNSGTLASGGTAVTNNQLFVVGDGADTATFQLNGGVHSFANNLVIQNNATLTGCGTIYSGVTVDPGGTVLADCGGQPLAFTGIVTNYGAMLIINGSALTADGLVVNYGDIEVIDGSTNFPGGFINHGSVSSKAYTSPELSVTNAFDGAEDGSYGTLPDHTYSAINGGYGYDLWTINGGMSGGGTYMEGPGVNSRGVPNTNDFSFALYAGGSGSAGPGNGGSGFALSRPLVNPLGVGELRFYSRFDLDAGNGQFNGFDLRAANNTNSFGLGQLLSFGLGGTTASSNQLTFTDAAGFHVIPSSAEARGAVWFWVVDFNAAAGKYALTVTNMSGTFGFTTNGNLIANGTTVGSFAAMNQSSGDDQNLIFDQLTFTNTMSVSIATAAISGTNVVLQIPSAYGFTYQLQVNTSPTPTNWTDIGASQAGTGGLLPFTDIGGATKAQRFYRVEVTAP